MVGKQRRCIADQAEVVTALEDAGLDDTTLLTTSQKMRSPLTRRDDSRTISQIRGRAKPDENWLCNGNCVRKHLDRDY